MGYTHYYRVRDKYPPRIFKAITDDFKKLLPVIEDKMGVYTASGKEVVVLSDAWGEGGRPTITDTEIIFNGLGEESHETFVLQQKLDKDDFHTKEKGFYFNFTKTARKPYDIAVTACLVIAKHYLEDQIIVTSDGDMEEWRPAMTLCQDILGYGEDFVLDCD